MTELAASGVTVVRNGRAIVDQVDIGMVGGQFVCLIGPNGAGKSTLLSALAGLLKPDNGEVMLDGVPIQAIEGRELARRRAHLPQNMRAEWPVSVERVVALGLIPQLPMFGEPDAEMMRRVGTAIEMFDLVDHREQPATTLSGGEFARAMLARAVVGDPAVLLVDEPLAGLDPRHALDGMKRLQSLATAGKLVVACVHDLTLAARYASHVAVMKQGRVIAFGPLRDILTAELIKEVFEVDACVSEIGTGAARVDFVPLD